MPEGCQDRLGLVSVLRKFACETNLYRYDIKVKLELTV